MTDDNKISINLMNDNIVVSELSDDIFVNGTLARYDSDNPYMFCKVEAISEEAKSHFSDIDLSTNVIVIKRYAKEEYLPGYYFISFKDVRGIIPAEDYERMIED